MGTRADGGPRTLDELLEHYRKMASEHWTTWRNEDAGSEKRNSALGASTAYYGAADELVKVMASNADGTPERSSTNAD